MNCAEFQNELQRQLDVGLVGDDDRIREHCRSCFACSEAWDGARLLSDSIAIWRGQLPEVDLVEAVVAAHVRANSGPLPGVIDSDAACVAQTVERGRGFDGTIVGQRRSAHLTRGRAIFAVTASLTALVAVSILMRDRDAPLPSESVPAIVQAMPAVQSESVPEEVALLNHAEAAYDTLTKSAVGALEEFAWIVIPIRLTDSEFEQGDAQRGRWIDGLQDQLQPLQDGLGEALEFLRDAGDPSKNTRT